MVDARCWCLAMPGERGQQHAPRDSELGSVNNAHATNPDGPATSSRPAAACDRLLVARRRPPGATGPHQGLLAEPAPNRRLWERQKAEEAAAGGLIQTKTSRFRRQTDRAEPNGVVERGAIRGPQPAA